MGNRLTLLALVSALGASLAFGNGANGPFVEKKGVQEFTGTMIVRPVQMNVLAQRGYSATEAKRVRQGAIDRLRSMRLRYYPEVDEVIVKVPKGQTESTLSQQLMKTGLYEYATPNWMCYPLGQKVTPNDPLLANQWHHTVMRSTEAWAIGKGLSNVTIAVVDTGVFTNHPDLKRGIVPGYNSVDRKAQTEGGQVEDINGHGTHVAGDAAAQGNNAIGVVGCGWNFKIMPVRTSNSPGGGASTEDITAGARWAIEHGAKVASASYSGVDDPAVGTTGTYIKSIGGLFLYAAGNDNRDLSGFQYKDTIVVGASNPSDVKAGFSAYGRGVGLFAPGESILSTTMDGGYQYFSGTSMATPVANGACALIWSINPNLEPDDVQEILYSTCDQIGPKSIYGHGRINLFKAAQLAKVFKSKTTSVVPSGIVTSVGKWIGGSLKDVQTGTGVGYRDTSFFNPQLGDSTVVEATFNMPKNAAGMQYLAPSFQLNATPGLSLTGQVFLYDVVAKKYVLVKATGLPRSGGLVTLAATVEQDFARFVGTGNKVKAAVRVLSPVGRRGEPGGAFTATLKYGEIQTRID